jgi:hypothetical protein
VSSVSHVMDARTGESRAGIAVGPSSISWRLVAGAALGVAVLYFASVAVGSLASLPGTDASAARVLAFFIGHRTGLLAAVVLNGIAWCVLMPVVFVGLRLRIAGEGSAAASLALGGALVESALIGVLLVFAAWRRLTRRSSARSWRACSPTALQWRPALRHGRRFSARWRWRSRSDEAACCLSTRPTSVSR